MSRGNSSWSGFAASVVVFGLLFCVWGLICPDQLDHTVSFFKANSQPRQHNVHAIWIQVLDEKSDAMFRKWQEWVSQNCQGNLGYITCEVGGRKIFFACDIQETPSFNYLVDGDIEVFGQRIFSSIEFVDDKFVHADYIEYVDGEPARTDMAEILNGLVWQEY